jgi:hypothetical protein
MTASLHPAASHHLPAFITAPGETDVLMVVMAAFLVVAVLAVGILFLRLHTLPERMAHKSQKLQFEIVAVLGLLALFTHVHLFWVAGLLLALIDFPDFGRPLGRIAGSLEKIAGIKPDEGEHETRSDIPDKRIDESPAPRQARTRQKSGSICLTRARSAPHSSSPASAGADSCLSFFSARW